MFRFFALSHQKNDTLPQNQKSKQTLDMSERKFWNSEKLLSIAAILISIGTFFTIIYQTNLIRKQQYASVLPYLEIWNSGMSIDSYELVMINNGVGPAFIEEVVVRFEGEEFKGDPLHFYQKEIIQVDTFENFRYSNIWKGRLIPAGKKVEMLGISGSKKNALKMREWYGGEKAIVEVVYSSIYGEKWRTGMGLRPQKIE